MKIAFFFHKLKEPGEGTNQKIDDEAISSKPARERKIEIETKREGC